MWIKQLTIISLISNPYVIVLIHPTNKSQELIIEYTVRHTSHYKSESREASQSTHSHTRTLTNILREWMGL